MKHLLRISVLLLAASCVACCNSSSPSSSDPSSPKAEPPSEGGEDPGPPADEREPVLATVIGKILESDHLRSKPLNDDVSRTAFEAFLESLDAGKMFLLQSHVAELRKSADKMDDQMKQGRLALADASAALMKSRVEVVEKIVSERLAEPFSFEEPEVIETDAEKLEFASTEEELAKRWHKNLELEVLSRVVRMEELAEAREKAEEEGDEETDDAGDAPALDEPIPETFEGREAKARKDLADSYDGRFARLKKTEPLERIAQYLNAIASAYDPHTMYLPPADKENFDIRMSGSLEGIGAVLTEDDHFIRVTQIVPGGASWRQGKLEAGDLILSVAQEGEEPVDVMDMRIDKVVKMIRGPKNSTVVLTVQKPDGEVERIAIVRDVVEIEAAYARGATIDAGDATPEMGYIYLPSFYGNTRRTPGRTPERSCTEDVRKLLGMFADRGLTGVILDLRGNGGGLLTDAQLMSGLFIETGPIVQVKAPAGDPEVLSDQDPAVVFDGALVVLVDRFSASASEIVAAALQDYGRAVVVGTGPTHGKGTVQVLLDLDRMGAGTEDPLGVLKLTRQQFFRVTGGSTQSKGVVPDVLLPDPSGYIESGERTLDNAIPWSQVEPLAFDAWTKKSWSIQELVAKSQTRQSGEKAFTMVESRNQLLKDRREQSRLPLSRKAYVERRESWEKKLEAVNLHLDEGPARLSVKVLNYNGKKPAPPKGNKNQNTGKTQEERWKESLSRDPWVTEALHVLSDMAR